ncbi:MAG: hypothetical protein IJW08_05355 [Lentisphaeria bacterium]|nr:hypothetical protein [Lentisphaeria bacterium]
MPVYGAVTSFNAGELSPKMIGRTDVSQYAKGCRKLCNFFVTPYGAVERRPGTLFVAKSKSRRVRLIKFVFSSDAAYVCEFGDRYIRFFRNGRQLVCDGAPVEIATFYTADQLERIQVIQSADVMTIVHPLHPVMELRRIEENSFVLIEKEFEYPPVLEPNIDDSIKITPSAVSGTIELVATADVFDAGNIGGFWQLVHTRKKSEIKKDFDSDGVSDTLEVFGNWTFTTHGTWTGNVVLQRSYDGGESWYNYQTFSSAKDSNTSTSGIEQDENVLYRVVMQDYEQSDTGTLKLCRILFVNPDFVTTGVVRITSVADARHASGNVIRKLGGTDATFEWNEGAWSNRRGFPCSVAFFEERMMFGGTASRPQTVWGSKTGDWDNFLLSDKDDAGLEFTLASDTVNTISWMCQHNALIIGTLDSEWTLSASDSGAALTSSNAKVKRQSVYGSSRTPALMVGDTVLFVQRGKRKIREFVYTWEKEGYSSPDMTVLAEHITRSEVIETTLQQLPDSILWCVLGNGTIAALTYERDQEVIGWHRHTTAGKFVSVCAVPDQVSNDIYFAVDRAGETCIEILSPRTFDDIADACFVDSAVIYNGTETDTIDNLDHLEGMTVSILADGALQTGKVVENGQVILDVPAKKVVIGLAYESVVAPMPYEVDMPDGTSMLRKKAVGEVRVRVYDSVGGEITSGNGDFQQVISRDVLSDSMDARVNLKTEVVVMNLLSGFACETNIEIRQIDPLPLNVSSLVITLDVAEK